MHLVGFTIEIYYDARPYESQICPYGTVLYEGQGLICFLPSLYLSAYL